MTGTYIAVVVGTPEYPLFQELHVSGKQCLSHHCYCHDLRHFLWEIGQQVCDGVYTRVFFEADPALPRPLFRAPGVGEDVIQLITDTIYQSGTYGVKVQ